MNWIGSKVRGDRCLVANDRSDIWMFKADPDPHIGFVAQVARYNAWVHFDGRMRPLHECDTETIERFLEHLLDDPFI